MKIRSSSLVCYPTCLWYGNGTNPRNEANEIPIFLSSDYTERLVVQDVLAQSACNDFTVRSIGLVLSRLTLSRTISPSNAFRGLLLLLRARTPVSFALMFHTLQSHLTMLLFAILLVLALVSTRPQTNFPFHLRLRRVNHTQHLRTQRTHLILILLNRKVIPIRRATALPRFQAADVGVQMLACGVHEGDGGCGPARSALGVAGVVDDEVVGAGCAAYQGVEGGVPELGRRAGVVVRA
jgi:hypothetical protein